MITLNYLMSKSTCNNLIATTRLCQQIFDKFKIFKTNNTERCEYVHDATIYRMFKIRMNKD